ncbi:formimidoylglutamase [Pullulanibacillus sp. KACC 23026]|uniref:formimidoylglutamase n=1 Tax=Pullulanibacillus sp. KACC 23026 TaxID=3028315 RepID=UPI0023B1955E|nr:formimidoylglutamase [Pullulanibacillus sp. KACC 23026]WEG13836.1 formimidoylglutamase [Pullulanibacillus sp. KACC 23026]
MSKPPFLKSAGQTAFQDSMVTKFGDVLLPWDGQEGVKGFGLMGLPLSKTSISHSGASFAPESVRSVFKNMATYAVEQDIDLAAVPWTDLGDVQMHLTDMNESHNRIASTMNDVMTSNPELIPILIGGDHSVTASAFSGLSQALRKKAGIIQLDAHHDLRNVEDGGPSNGTPFRRLIETLNLDPRHLVQIGIRNFANSQEYSAYAREKGVTVFTMREIREKGIRTIGRQAYQKLAKEVEFIYVSVDMDVLDQAYAPGCPAILPGGMHPEDLFSALVYLGSQSLTKAIDLVEIDPKLDSRDQTSRMAVMAFLSFVLGKQLG